VSGRVTQFSDMTRVIFLNVSLLCPAICTRAF